MTVNETAATAATAVPAPRALDEAAAPPGPGEPPSAGQRLWSRRIDLANKALCAISIAGFTLAVLRYRAHHTGGLNLQRGIGDLFWLFGWGVLLLATLGNLVLRPHLGSSRRIWAAGAWFSALCLAGTTILWGLVHNDAGTGAVPGVQVRDARAAAAYLDRTLGPRAAALPHIPTGAFVQSIEFTEADNVKVTGYLWQRYGKDVPASLRRGVALPESNDAYTAKQIYRVAGHGTETVGWYFQATLRQKFDYAGYPLDFQSVWLRMWTADLTRKAVLVPDFSAYPPWRIDRRYGVDPGFVSGAWRTRYTTYSYVTQDYKSSFGMGGYRAGERLPEMYFNVGIARDYLNPMISRLLPMLFVVVLVFLSLFVITMVPERRGLTGFSVSGVVGFAVSMLLVITVQHTSLREAVGDQGGFVYFEYFYAATYLVILLVALNAALTLSKRTAALLSWRANLLPKVLYWPLLLGLVFAATLWSFA